MGNTTVYKTHNEKVHGPGLIFFPHLEKRRWGNPTLFLNKIPLVFECAEVNPGYSIAHHSYAKLTGDCNNIKIFYQKFTSTYKFRLSAITPSTKKKKRERYLSCKFSAGRSQ